MATGKSMDQSKKKMEAEKCGYTMKDDKPHEKGSPEDKAHDVVEEGEKVPDAAAEVKGDPKKMFEHLRSYREMQAEGKGDEWKRSPENARLGKSGVSDPMLMSLAQRKEMEKAKGKETKHDRCVAEVSKDPKIDNPHAVCVAAGVEPESWKKSMPKSLNDMKKEEVDKRCWDGYEPTPGKKAYEKGSCQPTKKNDPAVSGTKVESETSGELGNKAKAKDESLSPLQSEPKQMIAEPIGDKYAKTQMSKSKAHKEHVLDYKDHSVYLDDWPRISERMNRYTVRGPHVNAQIGGMPHEHDLKIKAIKEEIDRKSSAVKKSMKEGGGVEWSDADVRRGLAFSAGGRVGATEGPNLGAQPLVKKENADQKKGREVPLHRVLEDMDDSKVKT